MYGKPAQIRAHFIEQHNLPYSFSFSRYLKRCLKNVFVGFAQVHWSVLAVVIAVEMLVWIPISKLADSTGVAYTVTVCLTTILSLVIYFKTHYIVKA